MSLHRSLFVAFALSSSFVAACATDGTTDDLAGTTAEDGALDDGKADASGVYTYYAVEPDLRKCASPVCGGHFVYRVNLGTTKCADGVYRAKCYVADVDLSGLGLSDSDLGKVTEMESGFDQRVLLKGTIGSKTYGSSKLGVFKATEAWLGGTNSSPDGVFVKIHDNGVRCIAAPCPSTSEKKLNSSRTANIAGIDFSSSGASDREIESLGNLLFSDGYIIAGDRYTVKENGRTAKGRTATQYWTRVLPACYVGGCSGQLCTDAPGAISTCEWRAEYACYHDDSIAQCARQVDGTCGWTQSDDLLACLANPPTN